MNRGRLGLVIGLLIPAVQAYAQIYKCLDTNRHPLYIQTPCPDGSSTLVVRPLRQGDQAEPPDSTLNRSANAELQFQRRQKEREDAENKASERAARALRKEDDCRYARAQAAYLETGRVLRMTAQGEQYFLSDEQLAQEKARTQALMAESCTK